MAAGGVAEVDDDLGALDDVAVVDCGVRGDDRDAVVALGLERRGAHPVELLDVRVVVADVGAGRPQQLDQLLGRRLAHVADVGLVGDAEDQDLRAGDRALQPVVQRLRDDRAAEVRHVVVDLAGELDEARREVVLARLPREVVGVERDAVPAEAGAGLERLEAERLGGGGVDDLPDVDAHPVAELRELVDERDVD